jgi:hypothetical protein
MLAVVVLACSLSTSLTVDAQEGYASDGQHDGGHASAHHGYHDNTLGVFVGGAHAGRRTNAAALGLEYERRINEQFGVGVVAEYTAAKGDFWVYMVPFAYHTGHWKFYVAPGIEESEVHGKEDLVRLGAEYAFALPGGWEIAPQLNVDLVESEDVWVVGVVFARGF